MTTVLSTVTTYNKGTCKQMYKRTTKIKEVLLLHPKLLFRKLSLNPSIFKSIPQIFTVPDPSLGGTLSIFCPISKLDIGRRLGYRIPSCPVNDRFKGDNRIFVPVPWDIAVSN
ncbi:hypothetical protein CDAR_192451 [Caerostris darwini]|uniref:Uncharacterized protein n=1 Tax=Caerostris darwini TaxID=1538125 RepID=A0AAV4W6Z3_9ARAC|nr:hypothetical protein CDAR_192451 [Caerostris darwini]